jgi:hypothetical protein
MAITPLAGTPITGTDGGGTAFVQVTIPAGTIPDGSLVVAIHDNDYRDYANMVAPVLSSFSPTMNFWGGVDGGSLLSHIKVWAFDYPAGAAASSRTLTCTETGTHDGDKGLAVWAFSGTLAAASALDGSVVASSSPLTAVTPHVLTGLTAAQAGEMLLAALRSSNGAGHSGWTPPGSMTEQYDIANFTRFTGANELLAASGATGTRTFTPSGSVPFVAVLLAILPSGGTTVAAAVSFGAAPTLTAAGTRDQPAAVTFGVAPTLTAAGTRVQPATVSMGAAPTLTVAGTLVKLGAVSFGSASVLTAAGTRVQFAAVAFGSAPVLTAAALQTLLAAVTFGAHPVLLATPDTPAISYVTAVLIPGALAPASLTAGGGGATLTLGAVAPATLTAGGL